MKNFIRITVSIGVLCAIMAFTTIERSYSKAIVLPIITSDIIIPEIKLEYRPIDLNVKDYDDFLVALGHRESGNRYDVVNKYGYMGRYQFGSATLKGLGIKVSKEEFLDSPSLQDYAMKKLLLHNRKKLRKFIIKYEGKVVNGIHITESGVLAAAHLAGAGNVKKFFNRGYEFKDGFGTKMTSYMVQFNGYNINWNEL